MGSFRAISVLILASTCILVVTCLDYSDLETMGVTCPHMVSCAAMGNPDFSRRNCECDRSCVIYNDCCIDARTRVTYRSRRRNSPYSCMPYGEQQDLGAYAVQSCSSNFVGDAEVQRKCQNQNNVSDPLMAAPVTDTTTRVTYRNRYCAECNDVAEPNLQSWLIRMACDFTSTINVSNSFIWENIVYRPDLNKWGVNINRNFLTCDVLFDKPEYLSNSVRLCRVNVVSSCPINWSRVAVKRECESYTAVMYSNNDVVYRNPHCALCNGLTMNAISCDRGISAKKKKPFSFALLLDVNQSDGDVVGVSRPNGEVCGPDQRYDPYFKKCRNLVCAIPGYKRINGKCQKPE